MAVVSDPLGTVLELEVQTGIDQSGNPERATRRYRNIKASATDQDVFDVGQALAGLQQHTLLDIVRVDSEELSAGV
ncbi:MAG: DUF1659 domain-containing protein [Peptococcaceae bacterium]|nr:DUF1659 domain-containing protein [Peptococcaceae bacterium]